MTSPHRVSLWSQSHISTLCLATLVARHSRGGRHLRLPLRFGLGPQGPCRVGTGESGLVLSEEGNPAGLSSCSGLRPALSLGGQATAGECSPGPSLCLTPRAPPGEPQVLIRGQDGTTKMNGTTLCKAPIFRAAGLCVLRMTVLGSWDSGAGSGRGLTLLSQLCRDPAVRVRNGEEA